MAPMKRNRNRDRKNVVRRRAKNSAKKGYKYSGSSDGSRVDRRTRRKITGYKLETVGARRKRKYQRMGAGRHSRLARGGNRESSDGESDAKDSDDVSAKRYIRKALEFGLASGYLIPDEDSGRQVLRVTSDIVQFAGGSGADRSGSEGRPDAPTGGRGRSGRGGRNTGAKRLAAKIPKNGAKNARKRGRSRTKSPGKAVVQKRRRKVSESRSKQKSRIQKRKRNPEAKNEPPASTRRGKATDADGADDEDDEPDPDVEEDDDKNSDEKNKLPVTSRPGSVVPNSDERTKDGEKKSKQDEPSEPSGDEGSSDDEEDEPLQEEDGLDDEDATEVANEEQIDNTE